MTARRSSGWPAWRIRQAGSEARRRGDNCIAQHIRQAHTGAGYPVGLLWRTFIADILPVTSELRAAPLMRVTVKPSAGDGLRKESQVMMDKIQTVPREKVGAVIGKFEDETMVDINRALAVFIGIA